MRPGQKPGDGLPGTVKVNDWEVMGNMRRAYFVGSCRSAGSISLRAFLFSNLLFIAVAPVVGQEEQDFQNFGLCAGYFSKELKARESATGKTNVASLRAESKWYNAKLASLPISSLRKATSADLGAQTFSLNVQRLGGPPADQVMHAQWHKECAEAAIKLFPAEANCFEIRGGGSVFVCESQTDASPGLGVTSDRLPGDAPPQDAQLSSLSAGPGSPTAAYKEFLNLRNKRQWSKMFDMFDSDSQHRFGTEMRQFFSTILPEAAAQADSMSDRDVFATVFKSISGMGEIRVLAEHITGDVAILDTKIHRNNTWYDADPPVELHMTNGKWMMYWPK